MAHFLTIQYLRAAAALLVVVYHVGVIFSVGTWAFPAGQAGVDIFFVISGFVMWVSARNSDPGRFFLRRILRIVPLYWAVTLFVALVGIGGGLRLGLDVPVSELFRSLFFIAYHNPRGRPAVAPIVGPGWTLNLEMYFYLIFALCLLFVRARIAWAIFAILAALALAGTALPRGYPVLAFYLQNMIIEFGLGVLLGWYVTAGRPLPGVPVAILMAAAGIMWSFSDLFQSGIRLLDWGTGAFLIVAAGVALDPYISRRPIPVLKFLGDASYSIYLTYLFAITAAVAVLAPGAGAAGVAMDIALIFTCAAVGSAVFALYERPVGRFLRSRVFGSKARKQLKPAASRTGGRAP